MEVWRKVKALEVAFNEMKDPSTHDYDFSVYKLSELLSAFKCCFVWLRILVDGLK